MKITLSDAGKRYNRDWIFRRLNHTFTTGNSYAIIGPNGSGKSTLLQCIAGAAALNEGKLQYQNGEDIVASSVEQEYVSIAAPYLELIEEMTVIEFLQFHQSFKPFLPDISIEHIIDTIGLQTASNKQIRYYSSGMKQRVKLAQAIFSNVPVILLDEPCTNLDKTGIELYLQLIHSYCQTRLVIVSSNDEVEYGFCGERVNVVGFK